MITDPRKLRVRSLVLVLVAALGATGCDPGGPGASGEVSLGPGVEPAGFQTFNIIAAAEAQTPFDPAAPVFPTTLAYESDAAPFPVQDPLAGMTFPSHYQTGQNLGTASQSSWRIFIWLSRSSAESSPSSGEPYGTTPFTVPGCGVAGGFCGVTTGVDVTIDQTVP